MASPMTPQPINAICLPCSVFESVFMFLLRLSLVGEGVVLFRISDRRDREGTSPSPVESG